MEFLSIEEFDRAFFASKCAAGDASDTSGDAAYGAPGGDCLAAGDFHSAAPRTAPGGPPGTQPVAQDPFLWDAAPPPAGGPAAPRKRTPLQTVNTVISYAIIVLLAVGILAFVAPIPFGVKMLNVTSGSMQPDYPIGSLLWVVPTKYERIKLGDDVTYQLPSGPNSTHRVMEIDRENRTLTVQGIHASKMPELISYGQVRGVVRFHVHGLGNILETLNESESGIYIKIMLILAVMLLWGISFFLSKTKPGQFSIQRRKPGTDMQ